MDTPEDSPQTFTSEARELQLSQVIGNLGKALQGKSRNVVKNKLTSFEKDDTRDWGTFLTKYSLYTDQMDFTQRMACLEGYVSDPEKRTSLAMVHEIVMGEMQNGKAWNWEQFKRFLMEETYTKSHGHKTKATFYECLRKDNDSLIDYLTRLLTLQARYNRISAPESITNVDVVGNFINKMKDGSAVKDKLEAWNTNNYKKGIQDPKQYLDTFKMKVRSLKEKKSKTLSFNPVLETSDDILHFSPIT